MRDKQIEEMAKDLCSKYKICTCNNRDGHCSTPQQHARIMYELGYRKQIEGKWQTSPDGTHWCSECGHDATYTFDGTEICGVVCPHCGAKMKGEKK